jgi:hypothetical protein
VVSTPINFFKLNAPPATWASNSVYFIKAGDAFEQYVTDANGNPVLATNTDFENSLFTQAGTGAVPRTLVSKLRDVVSVKDFGAVGNGTTNDSAAIQAAVATGSDVFFPKGTYYAPGLNIEFAVTDQTIFGSGWNSILKEARVTLNKRDAFLRDIALTGSGTYGVYIGDDASLRHRVCSNVYVRDKTYGIYYNNGATDMLFHCYVEACDYNYYIVGTYGLKIAYCWAYTATYDNFYLCDIGEVQMNQVTAQACGRNNLRIIGSAVEASVESYFSQCSFSQTQKTRSYNISSVANAGGGDILITTSADHTFCPTLEVDIAGTTNYNGTYYIKSVPAANQFTVTAAYVSSQTGTASTYNWDVYIEASDDIYRVNDMFFVGGNMNFLRINSGYNINFTGTRLKQQIWIDEGSRVMIVRNGRGRQQNTWNDIVFSGPGSNTGWGEVVYLQGGNNPLPGAGSIALRAPNKNFPVVNNQPSKYNQVVVSEDTVSVSSLRSGATVSISPGSVHSFTPEVSRGLLLVTNNSGQPSLSAILSFSTTTPSSSKLSSGGANLAVTTGVLTGTTGTAGDITISPHSDGRIYMENRTAGSQSIVYTLIG